MIVLIVAIGIGVSLNLGGFNNTNQSNTGSTSTSSSAATASGGQVSSVSQTNTTISSSSSYPQFVPTNPVITGGNWSRSYPRDYDTLANYALALINRDRENNGVGPVTLSPIASGQQHAVSMVYFGYFGHWDTQGYKPYTRYSLLGGTGAVSENVAPNYCTDATHKYLEQCNIQTIENAMNDSEWFMMNNDSACCNNGHRANILNPFHNRVSIGIAYNERNSYVAFVEDFENMHFKTSSITLSSGVVTFQATPDMNLNLRSSNGIYSAFAIYRDPLPSPIAVGYDPSTPELPPICLSSTAPCPGQTECASINQLSEPVACTYWGAYNQGTYVGQADSPCPQGYTCSGQASDGTLFVYSTSWSYTNQALSLKFPLSNITGKYGTGIYTLYLIDSQGSLWTSVSFVVGNSQG